MPRQSEGALAASRRLTSALLALIRTNQADTRADLAVITGLSRTNIAERVGALIDAGVVVEAGPGRSSGGRAPSRLALNPDAGRVVAVDLGNREGRVAVTDMDGRVLARTVIEGGVARDPDSTLDRVAEAASTLLKGPLSEAPLVGAGLGFPGPVQLPGGRPVSPAGLLQWDGFPLAEALGKRLGTEAWADNEANLTTLGELRRGRARGAQDVVLVKLGRGIGAGVVSRGTLHRGHLGGAGDIAHIPVAAERPRSCSCGRTSCLVTIAGGSGLARTARDLARTGRSAVLREIAGGRDLTGADLTDAAREGDAAAVAALREAAEHLGHVLAPVVNMLNPELVLLAGPVMAAEDFLLPFVRQVVYAESTPLTTRALRIERSDPAGNFGLVGAALTVIDELLSPERLHEWPSGSIWSTRPGS
ncbi:ROK family protein [Streptomyces sp. NPDC048179]|uniref:ROK family transcriptional regulator n=1 Tax=Streptomyces sp. NPDC048179 TaxID=3365506 RepID=UPI003713CEF5